MARNRKKSVFEDLIHLVSLLPWWAGLGIAAVGYVILHRLADDSGTVAAIQSGQTSHLLSRTLLVGVANVAQYLVPVIGVVGTVISLIRKKQRTALLEDVTKADSASALDGMPWQEFELLVGEAFRLQGFRIAETGGGGPDGGVDLVLTKGTEKFLVQCKQWKAFKVGVDVVRQLYGVMAAKGAAGGFVVTSGRYTDDAKAFANGRNLNLVDGPQLFAMIKKAKQTLPARKSHTTQVAAVQSSAMLSPSCPQCGADMLKRAARKGGNAGSMFWGCSTFPACRGVRQINDPRNGS